MQSKSNLKQLLGKTFALTCFLIGVASTEAAAADINQPKPPALFAPQPNWIGAKLEPTCVYKALEMPWSERRATRMSASTLLSYFDPQGLGHMPASAARFKKAVPIFYDVGTAAPLYPLGPDFIYNRAPVHPYSKYVVRQTDHGGTPEAAAADALAWVKGLP